MSELSELIQISKNIESQNREIIRLLKKIAGEDETAPKKESIPLDEYSRMILKGVEDIGKKPAPKPSPLTRKIPKDENAQDLLNTSHDVGEVYYIEECEIFKLTVKNNERSIDNLTGSHESTDFGLQEMIANESIRQNQSLSDSTVIINKSQAAQIPETLKICYDEGAENVYMPWSTIPQMVGAPDIIMQLMNITFYKTEDELLEMIFK